MLRSVTYLRRVLPAIMVLVLVAVTYQLARLPRASASDRAELASTYHFTRMHIELPPGLPHHTIRQVNPAYKSIQAWISSIGAAVALTDLSGKGVANDLCLVDPRSDKVIVSYAPNTPKRFEPFVLDPAPLPMDSAMAPTGCVPGDYNGDGRMDLLAYYMGRTPVLFLAKPDATRVSADAYTPTELVPQNGVVDGRYHGPRWQSTAVSVADFDGDGHPDIGVFNYFPDSDVLDPHGQPNVAMNHSMSNARNGGGAHILRFVAAVNGPEPAVRYQEADAIAPKYATGWTLAAASADLTGDVLPELYVANDFGPDHLLYNTSTPGHIRFTITKGSRDPDTPKSMVLGNDSFKGMAADFGDLANNGRLDCFVSNITTSFGIEESNFVWMNTASSQAAARRAMAGGSAPFEDRSAAMNMAWTGWGWDTKMADFNNSGRLSLVQTDGFVKGKINRWSWLQELAMTNDDLTDSPKMWPKAEAGDDIAGSQQLAFWVREPSGRYANLSHELGTDNPVPTRGVAVADTDNDGFQDFAVAQQWAPPLFYRNDHPSSDEYLGLRLYRPASGGSGGLRGPGTPAYGAQVKIRTASGRVQVSQLDGGSGHSGKRSFDVFFGLGDNHGQPVSVQLSWRDTGGGVHHQTLSVKPGWHDFMMGGDAREVAS